MTELNEQNKALQTLIDTCQLNLTQVQELNKIVVTEEMRDNWKAWFYDRLPQWINEE